MMLAQDLTNPLLLLGVILLMGTLLGAGAERLSAPWIIGSMIAGVLLGPEAIGVLSRSALAKLGGFSQASLAVIAFCIGSRLTFDRLSSMGVERRSARDRATPRSSRRGVRSRGVNRREVADSADRRRRGARDGADHHLRGDPPA